MSSSSDAAAGGLRLACFVNVFRIGKRRLRTEDGVIVRSGETDEHATADRASDSYCLGDSPSTAEVREAPPLVPEEWRNRIKHGKSRPEPGQA